MDPVKTAQELIAFDSVTSRSNEAVSAYTYQRLERLGFEIQSMPYVDAHGTAKVTLAAKRAPRRPAEDASHESSARNGIGFFCHTDVVSVDGWNCPHGGPFDGNIAAGRLWGRGACDMKGPTAAALAAIEALEAREQTRPIYFFATGDEECGMCGARLIAEQSPYFAEMVAGGVVGIIGEPTALQVVNSHKGGCYVDVSSTGVAAHSSTAEGINANWKLIPFLDFLSQLAKRCEVETSLRNEAFTPPTLSMNLVIENRPSASNITVATASCRILLRPMPDTNWQVVYQEICARANEMHLTVHTLPPHAPLHTPVDSPFVQTALGFLGQSQPMAVSYATDGCCFQQLKDLIVLGPGDIAQAHRADEWIDLVQLRKGVEVYLQLFRHFAFSHSHSAT